MLSRKISISLVLIPALAGLSLLVSGCAQQRVALPEERRLPPVVSSHPEPPPPGPAPSVAVERPQFPVQEAPPVGTGKITEEPLEVTARDTSPVPEAPAETPPQKPRVSEEDLRFVEQRLLAYEERYRQWVESKQEKQIPGQDSAATLEKNGCAEEFERILEAHRELRNRMTVARFSPWHHIDVEDIARLHRMDIEFLESECAADSSLGQSPDDFTPAGPDPSRQNAAQLAENQVVDAEKRGDSPGAIASYQDLVRNFPEHAPAATTREHYGLALLRSGRRSEAAAIFTELTTSSISSMEKTSPLQAQLRLADLLLASGNVAEATAAYTALARRHSEMTAEQTRIQTQVAALRSLQTDRSEETNAYLALFRGVTLFDGKENGAGLMSQADRFIKAYPSTPLGESARSLRHAVEEQLTSWSGQKLRLANQLIREQKKLEAQAVLEELAAADLPPAIRERVQTMLAEVSSGRIQGASPVETATSDALSARWETANTDLDASRYDEAIQGYRSLLETEYGPMARIKLKDAAEKAATDNRKKAATLFGKATRTADGAEKRNLLLSSRKLLVESLEKYPQAEITGKVRQNLDDLDQYITRFDPSLLESAGTPGTDQGIRAF